MKIGIYNLPNALVRKMDEYKRITAKTGIEHGFSLCSDNGNVFAGKECKGDTCSIKYKGCRTGKEIGSFHTHPGLYSEPTPSIPDLVLQCLRELSCIASTYSDTIKCYIPDNKDKCYDDIHEYDFNKNLAERRVEYYIKEADELVKKIKRGEADEDELADIMNKVEENREKAEYYRSREGFVTRDILNNHFDIYNIDKEYIDYAYEDEDFEDDD